jgi:hypothetical protein
MSGIWPFKWKKKKSEFSSTLELSDHVPRRGTLPSFTAQRNILDNFSKSLSPSLYEPSHQRNIDGYNKGGIIREGSHGYVSHTAQISDDYYYSTPNLEHLWRTHSSIRRISPSHVQIPKEKPPESLSSRSISIYSKWEHPFMNFKSVNQSNWTLLFTNKEEKNYSKFSYSQRLHDLDIACIYWISSLIFIEILNETVKNSILEPMKSQLRIWYIVSLALTLVIWIIRLQRFFKVGCGILFVLLSLNASILGVGYSSLASYQLPNVVLFLIYILIYALLNIHFVLALFFSIIPTIVDVVNDVRDSSDWKFILTDICFYIIANFFGVFYCYQRELYRRKVYLKMVAIAEAQAQISHEAKKSESLLLAILPERILLKLRDTIGKSIDPSSALPHIRDYTKASVTHQSRVTIVYADIVNFTSLSSRFSADRMVFLLNLRIN